MPPQPDSEASHPAPLGARDPFAFGLKKRYFFIVCAIMTFLNNMLSQGLENASFVRCRRLGEGLNRALWYAVL
jgi:hypothetical protein